MRNSLQYGGTGPRVRGIDERKGAGLWVRGLPREASRARSEARRYGCGLKVSLGRRMKHRAIALAGLLTLVTAPALSSEWCTLTSFQVTENSGTVSVLGTLAGSSGSAWKEWLPLDRTENTDIGKQRLAMALAASPAGKSLTAFAPGSYTCVNVSHWTRDVVLHLRVM